MAIIRTLAVSITAKTGKFQKGMQSASKRLRAFGAAAGRASKMIGKFGLATTAAAVGGVALMVKNTLPLIDQIAKLSDETGISTEQLVGFRQAANLSGTDVTVLTKGLQRLVRRLGEAAKGYGEGVRGLEAMGLNAKEVAALPVAEAFKKIAQAIKDMKSPTERAAAAYTLFGRQGQELMNFLLMGKDGLEAVQKQVEALGLTFSRTAGGGVEEAVDAINNLNQAFLGLKLQMTIGFAGQITKVTRALTGLAVQGGELSKALKDDVVQLLGWGAAISASFLVIPKLVTGLIALSKALGLVASGQALVLGLSGPAGIAVIAAGAAAAGFAIGAMAAKFDAVTESIKRTLAEAAKLGAEIDKAGVASRDVLATKASGLSFFDTRQGKILDGFQPSDGAQKRIKALQDQMARLRGLDPFGGGAGKVGDKIGAIQDAERFKFLFSRFTDAAKGKLDELANYAGPKIGEVRRVTAQWLLDAQRRVMAAQKAAREALPGNRIALERSRLNLDDLIRERDAGGRFSHSNLTSGVGVATDVSRDQISILLDIKEAEQNQEGLLKQIKRALVAP